VPYISAWTRHLGVDTLIECLGNLESQKVVAFIEDINLRQLLPSCIALFLYHLDNSDLANVYYYYLLSHKLNALKHLWH